ncbi:capsular exopolysaccharide family [Desulfofarcimen acetoxidans DSM 771]|uniref:non-specific protein-tyrosine kinase n=1 Tax=Desulfofarcimen acetoxidans (strain ATCC 49208 / DSM 771 / KCTC 5769 / VKM B-1644 / 5575) TaxID=485916 RepID=C8VYQ6_DESAS|nr:CpsD/CapB family tyrosine-protein kinase [Desulfofarcimen acetoxidans]ACV64777.1 capsular exopolysaccharide family [Desulfofarcimen acetoxidans DSM 771]
MAVEKLITLHSPKSPIAEAYRILRTNIQFSSLDKPIKSLLVTSAGPNEGKSLTVANLAVAFAQAGLKVLIIDCDMRKPTQHKIFELSNIKGLSNVLIGELSLMKGLLDVGIEGLKLLPTGPTPPNPSELLGSQRMKNFIAELYEVFDIILVDTPPVVPVTDAALMAANVDGVLLVVASGQAKIEMTLKAKELLLNVNARIIGTVLNMLNVQGEEYYYYYYYYSGEDGGKKPKNKGHRKKNLPAATM